ncbi:Molybdopterin or thiamine biosynthesis adenylyltransferase [Geosporobacter subterraneus DSM 17957]|uniref:Molybdopterin or thiamine biosynthesis adenylyltransferase n=1 Tax=Geosporobacter subterraneus DSM 17957 TaxID=1121919 RepID=A0A1M6J9M1_9FIRM|nr:HesA/MoeB/ThiF family protein [Geosporobacter subterraneus]SHJ43417.1 Molybdopterin or thiamine biosynthesis adenylyltransferase [Geosporobacter subterraneus DSM 17957]
MKRYSRNMSMLSHAENEGLNRVRICVVGCGGLGGHIIEMLGRIGIGTITAVDGDVFEESNLNRQILSDVPSLGQPKAVKAKERMALVNPFVHVEPFVQRLDSENAIAILKGHELIMDALDNIESRFVLQEAAEQLNIPLIHGAIAGWYGQVSTIFPGDKTLNFLYPDRQAKGLEKELGNPSFTPALVASIQVSEAIKVIIGRGELLRRKILFINTLEQEYEIIEL